MQHHGVEIDEINNSKNDSDLESHDSKKNHLELSLKKQYYEKVVYPDFSSNIYMELDIKNLQNTYLRAQRDLEDTNNYFNINSETILHVLKPHLNKNKRKHKLRVIFEEICYKCNLTYEEVSLYLNMLKIRIEDIE